MKAHFENYFLKRQRKQSKSLPSTFRAYVINVNKFLDWEQAQPRSSGFDLDACILDFSRKEWVRLPIPDGYRESLEKVGGRPVIPALTV